MVKKGARTASEAMEPEGRAKSQYGQKKRVEEEDGDGEGMEFEDELSDEFASEEAGDEMAEEDDEAADMRALQEMEQYGAAGLQQAHDSDDDDDDAHAGTAPRVWRGDRDGLGEGETLVYDSRAYDLMYAMNSEWPCLSVDLLRDDLGMDRTRFPHTVSFVAGTQAEHAPQNKLFLLRTTQLYCTRHDEDGSQQGSDDEDDEARNTTETGEPMVFFRAIKHQGAINRVRMMRQAPPGKYVAATWAETGQVHLWDLSDEVAALNEPALAALREDQPPLFTFEGHAAEGFAMSWSETRPGRLVTGDVQKYIYLWEPGQAGWTMQMTPYAAHSSSVEDLQWSPVEETVFASCSSDRTVKVWDTRMPARPGLSVRAHDCDVNVLAWNRLVSYMLVTGADDGSFRVWDLRNFKPSTPIAQFNWHREQITAVQWHPSDESVLAVAAGDHAISLWDLSLERDEQAEADARAPRSAEREDLADIPPQLLFVHQGLQDPKEVHWHPQIPGLLLATGENGFNIFKPENM